MRIKGRAFKANTGMVIWPIETIYTMIGKPLRIEGQEQIGTITSAWIDDEGWVCFSAETINPISWMEADTPEWGPAGPVVGDGTDGD